MAPFSMLFIESFDCAVVSADRVAILSDSMCLAALKLFSMSHLR